MDVQHGALRAARKAGYLKMCNRTSEKAPDQARNERADLSILGVVPESRAAELAHIVSHTRWQLHLVHSVADVAAVLRSRPISVVLCESELADGTWEQVIGETDGISPRPLTIVLAATSDERLWASVLNLGGYDLISRPLRPSELYTLVPMAWRHWARQQHETSEHHEPRAMTLQASAK